MSRIRFAVLATSLMTLVATPLTAQASRPTAKPLTKPEAQSAGTSSPKDEVRTNTSTANPTNRQFEGFGPDKLYLGGTYSSTFGVGAVLERAVGRAYPEYWNGRLGVSVMASYRKIGSGSGSVTSTPITGLVNYHFRVGAAPRLDPFIGAGLTYFTTVAQTEAVNFGNGVTFGGEDVTASTTSFALVGGARWFVTPRFAIQAQIGSGIGSASAGATIAF